MDKSRTKKEEVIFVLAKKKKNKEWFNWIELDYLKKTCTKMSTIILTEKCTWVKCVYPCCVHSDILSYL